MTGEDEKVINRRPAAAVLLSHPTGNQNVRNALRSLVDHQMLAEYWTTWAWNPASRWGRFLPAAVRAQLARRTYPEAPAGQVRSVLSRETVRVAARFTPFEKLLCSGERPFSIIGVYRHFDRRVARRVGALRPGIVYAYEGGALHTFREARKRGIATIYEQPSSYWHWARRLMTEEAGRNPQFAGLFPTLADPPSHLAWKDEELQLADYVFVASQHVRRTLAGVVPDEKIRVVSYGAPPVRERRPGSGDSARPLLFVGWLAQHKGIGYLLDAVDTLGGQVELTLVGERFSPNERVDEACRRRRWFESLPHGRVLELMQEADVLALPSLSDGFGLVVTEALSSGLPVIVTPNVGSSDLIRDGREGFIVPICRSDDIAARLTALHRDREMLLEMSRQAQATAARNSWAHYRAQWAGALQAVLDAR